jgi:hypothetical protein
MLEQVKKFFVERGVRVAGGMALSDGGSGQFRSFCYTDPNDRAFIKKAVELAARHFDEVIQDDFFFVTTKFDSDIAAKRNKSWTQFRLDLMNEAAESLLVKPARAANPKVKMVIKFPNWYEHFQGSGYDLDKEPKLFDGIYILGSPLFDKAALRLDPKFTKGRSFTVVAKNNSDKNPYIQSATLNGKPITRSWISHDEITAGGKLVLTMGPTPNKVFGSAPANRPPKI